MVYIASDDGRRVVHSFAATGPSIDMAVQQVAYVALTVLRNDYYAFNDSPYRYIPRGYLTEDVPHFTGYDNLGMLDEDSTKMEVTAKFACHSDMMTQALTQELATTKVQLREALTRLATYTPDFVREKGFAEFQLPSHTPLPDAGGYEPDRGPLLNIGPGYSGRPLYGAQAGDAHSFGTPRIFLQAYPIYRDRRREIHRYHASYRHPAQWA